jgi:hypothetical protein
MFRNINASGSQRMALIGIELAEISIVKNGLARFVSGVLKTFSEMAFDKKATFWHINVMEMISLLKISRNYWYHATLSDFLCLGGLIKQWAIITDV